MNPPTFPARPKTGSYPTALYGRWCYEPKLNGWRTLVHKPSGRMFNRHLEELSIGCEFGSAIEELRERFQIHEWIDCEAMDRRHSMMRGHLIVLDLPEMEGDYITRRNSIIARLADRHHPLILDPCCPATGHTWYLDSFEESEVPVIWESMQLANIALGVPFYEGLVAKRASSTYHRQLRSDHEETTDWVKMRFA